jgi:hypothetical protein
VILNVAVINGSIPPKLMKRGVMIDHYTKEKIWKLRVQPKTKAVNGKKKFFILIFSMLRESPKLHITGPKQSGKTHEIKPTLFSNEEV